MIMDRILIAAVFLILSTVARSQSPATPTVVEILEDDHVATISWNSLTQIYGLEYDPDKHQGIYSYLIEWGTQAEGFVHKVVTPYRAHQVQPLEPGVVYQARISALGVHGQKSDPSEVVTFQHDPTRVNAMRQRLNGFFDDMNYPMGAFEETKWNQSYSGCMKMGYVSQHINQQYHGHNVIASNHCDRAFASSRARTLFDFKDRTGTIEFDMDGAHAGRNEWYLDLTPGSRKSDVTGHINSIGDQSDPAHLLRIQQNGDRVRVQLADANGVLRLVDNVYENEACGVYMEYCPERNLRPLINVRRHWKVELSITHIRIYIDEILVVDGSLVTPETPEGLGYEVAQVNWTTFSYNTIKESLVMSMLHWDNFGFDAPTGNDTEVVVHNYSDGTLGTETARIGNEMSIGMRPQMDEPAVATIPIPDAILDQDGNAPIATELMFTLQGGHGSWLGGERIEVNGHSYPFAEPTSSIPGFSARLLSTHRPYSAVVDIDPAHLLSTGDNEIKFYLDRHRILNLHLELTFPSSRAPSYTQPKDVFADHHSKLMAFRPTADAIGPSVTFREIDGIQFWTDEFTNVYDPTPEISTWYVKQTPVEDVILLTIHSHSLAQLAAKGTANGISYYEIWMDKVLIKTVRTDLDHPVAASLDSVWLDTREFTNGSHELFVQAFDVNGNPSIFVASASGATSGEYLPTIINIQNETTNYQLLALDESITIYPNPTDDFFRVHGDLDQYDMTILRSDGSVFQKIDAVDDSTAVDVSQLPQGVYFIRLIHVSNQKLSVQKMIKS